METARSFFEFVDRPLDRRARPLLALLVVPLALSFAFPIWRITMEAPQYPQGLQLDIYSYTIVGGGDGEHIQEINTLNHYIGMHKIDRQELSDLDWMPFAIGILALLVLRVAAVGNVRSLVDVAVLSLYVLGFAFARFIYKLYSFGHNLDPEAPVKIKPFTPVIIGTKQIANFTTHSWPALGSILIGVFVTGVAGTLVWHLVAGWRRARGPESRAVPGTVATAH